MTELTVEVVRAPGGYDFLRSDGLHFFLVTKPSGNAVLHLGRRWSTPPALGLVDFDETVFSKIEAARRWILNYRP